MTRHCLDLFAGLGGFSSAFEASDDWEVMTVDIDNQFAPDIHADVLDLRPRDFETDFEVILASPPCTAFSLMASGTHLDDEGRPKTNWGAMSLALVHHTVGLIKGLDPEWWFLENPMGGLRREFGKPDAHIWWCQYGSNRAKPTDLWGRIPPSFDERRCYNGNDGCDHDKAPRGSPTGTNAGDLTPAERARIPRGISEAVLRSVETPRPTADAMEGDW